MISLHLGLVVDAGPPRGVLCASWLELPSDLVGVSDINEVTGLLEKSPV